MNPGKVEPERKGTTGYINVLDIACYLNSIGERGDLWRFYSGWKKNAIEPAIELSQKEQIANCLNQIRTPQFFKDKNIAVLASDSKTASITENCLGHNLQLKKEIVRIETISSHSNCFNEAKILLETGHIDFVILLDHDPNTKETYLLVLNISNHDNVQSLCILEAEHQGGSETRQLFDNQMPGYIVVNNSRALETAYDAFSDQHSAVSLLESNTRTRILPDLFSLILSVATKSMFPSSKVVSQTKSSGLYLLESFRPWVQPQKPSAPVPRVGALIKNEDTQFVSIKVVETTNQIILFDQMFENEVFLLNAPTKNELIENLKLISRLLSNSDNIKLSELAYTINCLFKNNKTGERLGIVASNQTDLDFKIQKAIEAIESERQVDLSGIYYEQVSKRSRGKTAYLLPGLGSAYENMLWDLYLFHPVTRESFDFFDHSAREYSKDALPSNLIYPGTKNSSQNRGQLIEQDSAVVTVLLASYVLDSILKDVQLKPDAYLGMSTGEFGTYILNGYANIKEAQNIFYKLSIDVARQIPQEKINKLVSINIFAPARAVENQISSLHLNVYLIADLGPEHVIVTGDSESIEELKSGLMEDGIVSHPMPAPIPYHTPLVSNSISDQEAIKFSKALSISEVSVPSWVCSTKSLAPTQEHEVTDLCKNLFERPIYFRETVEAMYKDGVTEFIEVGPNGILTTKVKEILKEKDHLAFASNLSSTTSVSQLNHLIAKLFVGGKNPNLSSFYKNRSVKPLELLTEPERNDAPVDESPRAEDNSPSDKDILVSSYLSTLNKLHASTLYASSELLQNYFKSNPSGTNTISLKTGDRIAILSCMDEYGIAHLSESSYNNYFLESEIEEFENRFSNKERQKHWLMGRLAAKLSISKLIESQLNLIVDLKDIEILYQESGSPKVTINSPLVQNQLVVVSISHTEGLACALSMFSTENDTVGVDIERVRKLDSDLNSLVLDENESDLLPETDLSSKSFIKVWTAKEALYKAIGGKSILQYKVNRIDSSSNTIELLDKDKLYTIATGEFGDYIISYYTNHSSSTLALKN